jgi:phenylacetate-CoA ligase
VECEALSGYHLREADLYFEITDPESGKTQAPGVLGEIVFTTLTRTGMPLIRYRTGDLAEFMTAPCPCGTVLRRMGRVRGRLHEMVQLRTGEWLGIPDLDEALFPFSEIVNYSVSLIPQQHADSLKINIYPKLGADLPDQEAIRNALLSVPQVKSAVDQGYLSLQPVSFTTRNWITTGVAKRSIVRATNNKSLDR